MMRLSDCILLVLLLPLSVSLYAQGYNFSYKPSGKNIAEGRKIQTHSAGVIGILAVQEFSPAKIGHCAAIINNTGMIISEYCLTDSFTTYPSGAISGLEILPDTTYIYAGTIREGNYTYPMTYRLEAYGALLDTIRFSSGIGNIAGVIGRYVKWDNSIIVLALTRTSPDVYLIKYDINFNVIWHKQVTQLYSQQPIHLQVDDYGNFYVSGATQLFSPSPIEVWYPFLMKFNSSGDLIWQKNFNLIDSEYNTGSFLFFNLMPDDCILASAARIGLNSRGNMVLFKLDTAGNELWKLDVGPKDRSTSLASALYSPSDNSYIICGGYLGTEFGSGGLLVKLDTSGNPIFIKQYYAPYAPGADSGQNALVDIYVDQNRIYATGTEYRNYHAWFLSTDLNGCISPGDCGQNIPLSITRSTGGEQDALVVYPNPATTHVFVSCNPAIFKETLHLQLLDVSGRILWASETASNAFNVQIDLRPFPVGIYVLQVSDGIRNEYVRVMKQ
jgi:hypothetical protein